MKAPVLVGVVIVVVIVAVAVFVPMLTTQGEKNTAAAQAQAILAGRQLARVSPVLPQISTLAQTGEVEAEQLKAALETAGDALKEARDRLTADAQAARQLARTRGEHEPKLDLLPPETALRAFAQVLKDNDELLKQAGASAKEAARLDGQALGVQHAAGMVEYARALQLLAQAERLRAEQAEAQVRLLGAATRWKLAQAHFDQQKSLNVGPIERGLKADLEEITAARTEAHAEVERLTAEVAEREQKLNQVEQELAAATAELNALRDKGFAAGDDSAFEAYRRQQLALSRRVLELQEQDHELRYGGLHGGVIQGDDLQAGEIQGGEPVISLEELKARLAIAEERARRLDGASTSLDEHTEFIASVGQRAQEQARHFREGMGRSVEEQQELARQVDALEREARAKEEEALAAARGATRAFGQASAAAEAWIRAARAAQEADPQRKNERLTMILDDPYFEQVARSAEAAARLLEGRICALRAEYSADLIDDMRLYADYNTGAEVQFKPEPIQEALTTARDEGRQTVEKAAEIYNRIAERLAPKATDWLALAGKAAAYHLLARLDPDKTAEHRATALEAVQKALAKREQSPYLAKVAVFRNALAEGGATTKPAAEPEKTPDKEPGEKSAEQPEGEKKAEQLLGE